MNNNRGYVDERNYKLLTELQEIADGAWGDSDWMRGLAKERISAIRASMGLESDGFHGAGQGVP